MPDSYVLSTSEFTTFSSPLTKKREFEPRLFFGGPVTSLAVGTGPDGRIIDGSAALFDGPTWIAFRDVEDWQFQSLPEAFTTEGVSAARGSAGWELAFRDGGQRYLLSVEGAPQRLESPAAFIAGNGDVIFRQTVDGDFYWEQAERVVQSNLVPFVIAQGQAEEGADLVVTDGRHLAVIMSEDPCAQPAFWEPSGDEAIIGLAWLDRWVAVVLKGGDQGRVAWLERLRPGPP